MAEVMAAKKGSKPWVRSKASWATMVLVRPVASLSWLNSIVSNAAAYLRAVVDTEDRQQAHTVNTRTR